jgi:hypothetical protein
MNHAKVQRRQEGIACAEKSRVARSAIAAAPRLRFGLGLRNNFPRKVAEVVRLQRTLDGEKPNSYESGYKSFKINLVQAQTAFRHWQRQWHTWRGRVCGG